MASSPAINKSKSSKLSKEDRKRKRADEISPTKKHKSKKRRSEIIPNTSKEEEEEEVTSLKSTSQAYIPPRAPSSPFCTQTTTLYLPLSPISQRYPLEGLCAEHLSPLILTYYPPLASIILSYSNIRIAETPFASSAPSELRLKCIDEFGVSWAWVTVDFLLFKPEKGVELEGVVNLTNEGHLGLVCWNLFNASIERGRLPADWKWVSGIERDETAHGGEYAEEGQGWFVDGNDKKVEGKVIFRVKDIESSADRERGFLSIEGTMLAHVEEEELVEKEVKGGREIHVLGSGNIKYGAKSLGATSLGVPREHRDDRDDIGDRKHRQKY